MTGNDEDVSIHAIEIGRRLGRALASKLMERGVSAEDASIAAAYSAVDLAAAVQGSVIGGVEWLRTAIDVIERQVLIGSDLDGIGESPASG